MSISISRYVAITSGVAGGNNVRQRDLILRIMTQNPLVPTGSFIEFSTLSSVAQYFTTTSEEYLRATFYFGFISKDITTPEKISFGRWANVATAPLVYGNVQTQALASYTSITNGAMALTLGATTAQITGMNFSGAASLAAVAAIIQTAVRAQSGTLFTGATVTFDPVAGRFNLVGGATGNAVIAVASPASGTDISTLIGWNTVGAILSNGVTAETITQTLINQDQASTNFGSFIFTTASALTLQNVTDAATWNDALNVKYFYSVPVSSANASAWSAALFGLSGVSLTLAPLSTEYPEMLPTMVMAATRYDERNCTQNYMFQQDNLTPSVITDLNANIYDPLRVNYYGVTQTAGQLLAFYQRGTMMGLATDPVDQNIFANEIWLKDYAAVQIMTLLLSLAQVAANNQGYVQIMGVLITAVNQALFNGVISVGKKLTTTQQLFITQATGDATAWRQVQNIGYWLGLTFSQIVTTDGRTEYQANYTLIYSKNDSIRKVVGQHDLI